METIETTNSKRNLARGHVITDVEGLISPPCDIRFSHR